MHPDASAQPQEAKIQIDAKLENAGSMSAAARLGLGFGSSRLSEGNYRKHKA